MARRQAQRVQRVRVGTGARGRRQQGEARGGLTASGPAGKRESRRSRAGFLRADTKRATFSSCRPFSRGASCPSWRPCGLSWRPYGPSLQQPWSNLQNWRLIYSTDPPVDRRAGDRKPELTIVAAFDSAEPNAVASRCAVMIIGKRAWKRTTSSRPRRTTTRSRTRHGRDCAPWCARSCVAWSRTSAANGAAVRARAEQRKVVGGRARRRFVLSLPANAEDGRWLVAMNPPSILTCASIVTAREYRNAPNHAQ